MDQRLWQILSMINGWVRYSDGKAVALLGIQGILIGLIIAFIKDSYSISSSTLFSSIFLIAGIISIAASMVFTFLCLSPRLKNSNGISPIFFRSIATNFQNSNEYMKYLQENFNSEENISKYLSEQIHANSKIANKKFGVVSWATRLLMLGLAFWVVLFISMLF